MAKELIDHFRNYIALDTEEAEQIMGFFQSKTCRKREELVATGTKCKFHFFVVKGCLRMFFTDQKGNEQTIQFAIENWWLTDYFAFENQMTTDFTIQAIEQTNVFQITYKDQEKLLKQFPKLERYFRLIYQRAYSASQLRTKYFYDFSREEFYHHFNDNFPEFTRRIPQHILASYLNMTPEYLSEIKSKKRS